jgi:hypothetical protein
VRSDDVGHLAGGAVDALPPHFKKGVRVDDAPLYRDDVTIFMVEDVVSRFGVSAIVESGHVHFYDPRRVVPVLNAVFGTSIMIDNT